MGSMTPSFQGYGNAPEMRATLYRYTSSLSSPVGRFLIRMYGMLSLPGAVFFTHFSAENSSLRVMGEL